jgi:catechol 2,3-dioxygenase-like lactoylglutathione lyase family enzyme
MPTWAIDPGYQWLASLARARIYPILEKLDFIGVPSTDAERTRAFYVDTLGLRPDERGRFEFWVGQTCFGIWEPSRLGIPFAPQKNAHLALHVDDVAAARAELEATGIVFRGETFDTGVCQMAFFTDPDGNGLMLHCRYAARAPAGGANSPPESATRRPDAL